MTTWVSMDGTVPYDQLGPRVLTVPLTAPSCQPEPQFLGKIATLSVYTPDMPKR